MKLARLHAVAKLFSHYRTLFSVRRIKDNLLALVLDFDVFYLDMRKSKSNILMSETKLLGSVYNAPFDQALLKYCSRAEILGCRLDGNNRILILEFLHTLAYKKQKLALHFEFTGRYTNVILVDEEMRILEALRHIGENQSTRIIKPQKILLPLAQPKEPVVFTPEDSKTLKTHLLQEFEAMCLNELREQKKNLISNLQKKLLMTQEYHDKLPNLSELQAQKQQYQKEANLLLMHLHTLGHFQTTLTLQDLDLIQVQIKLPAKARSFQEGANLLFLQSKKCQKKIENLYLQQEHLQSKLAFLAKQIEYVKNATSLQDLEIFRTHKNKKQKQEKKPYESFFLDGLKISIGKNQKENQKLLEDAKADDIWLHIQNIPSSHMIIHCGKMAVREEVLAQSAKLLVGLNGILDKNIIVDYTKRKFVRIIEGANVVYSKQKSLRL